MLHKIAFFTVVTGFSLGTLVVEAAEKSGSLVSARLTLEQGRELLALPASLHNGQARGSLQLLRTGATLVCESDDIVAQQPGGWVRRTRA